MGTNELHPRSSVYAFTPLFLSMFSKWIDFCLSRLMYYYSSINNTNQHYHASFLVFIFLSNQILSYSLVLHIWLHFPHLCVIFNVRFQLLVGKSNFSFVVEMNLIFFIFLMHLFDFKMVVLICWDNISSSFPWAYLFSSPPFFLGFISYLKPYL